jgi:hypothetical protein
MHRLLESSQHLPVALVCRHELGVDRKPLVTSLSWQAAASRDPPCLKSLEAMQWADTDTVTICSVQYSGSIPLREREPEKQLVPAGHTYM